MWEPMALLRYGLALRSKWISQRKVSKKMPMDQGHPLSNALEGSENQTWGVDLLGSLQGVMEFVLFNIRSFLLMER